MAGLAPDDFWDKTLPEMRFIVKSAISRIESDHERQRALLYEGAQLTALAHHAPKKIPDYKPLKRKVKIGKPTQADDAKVQAFFLDLSMRGRR